MLVCVHGKLLSSARAASACLLAMHLFTVRVAEIRLYDIKRFQRLSATRPRYVKVFQAVELHHYYYMHNTWPHTHAETRSDEYV
jgi:hypothetical protein